MNTEMREKLFDLINVTWKYFYELYERDIIVKPSIPILFFGDYQKYLDSKIKVVTVGLNPSNIEFPNDSPFSRFKGGNELYKNYFEQNDRESKYIDTLSDYYREKPYKRWFNVSYEYVIQGINSSYYDGMDNIALHTDLFLSIATKPTWSKLEDSDKIILSKFGVNSWHRLIDILQPDVILYANAPKYLEYIEFIGENKNNVLFESTGKRHLIVTCQWLPTRKTLFVIGPSGQNPFAYVSHEDKLRIGKTILQEYKYEK